MQTMDILEVDSQMEKNMERRLETELAQLTCIVLWR